MTFVLHWRRDGGHSTPALLDRLASGLTRLRADPVSSWTRGSLTVLSFEHSPGLSITERPAGLVALLNGRLDDFAHLVARLGGAAVLGRGPTDADVLAAAYEKWGERCFEHLIGDFAAVIWEPARGSLLCARDVIGIAPLYYWSNGGELVVAGHLGGVVTHPEVRREPNEGYIAEILADEVYSRDETLTEDVRRLIAGHAARFDRTGSPRVWKWGTVEPLDLPRDLPDEAYDELYRDLLTQAIRDRMRGPTKVGVELSGGLDSSSIATLAAPLADAEYGTPLRSYSLTYSGLPCDETPYIRAVAAKAGLNPTLVPRPQLDVTHLSGDVESTRDLPSSPNGTAWPGLHRVVAADGLGALLDGDGGDQWFDVDSRYPSDLLRRGAVRQAWRLSASWAGAQPRLPAMFACAVRPMIGDVARRMHVRTTRQSPPPWISSSLAVRAALDDRMHQRLSMARSTKPRRARVLTAGWEALAHEAQALIAAQGTVVTRYPFFDTRIAAFALGLDDRHRWAPGASRTIQRRAMAGKLPEDVRTRATKADFSILFADELSAAGGRKRFANLTIVTDCGWLNADELVRRYDELQDDVRRGVTLRNIWPLWLALSMDYWYQGFIAPRLAG